MKFGVDVPTCFIDVESYPKPLQAPLPIFSAGLFCGQRQRRHPACWGAESRGDHNRLQSVVCIADTAEQAREHVERFTFDLFRRSLTTTVVKGVASGHRSGMRESRQVRRAGPQTALPLDLGPSVLPLHLPRPLAFAGRCPRFPGNVSMYA